MSLLNPTRAGLPNVLLALRRYLRAGGPTPEATLLAACAPAPVCDPARAKATLDTWIGLGLFNRSDDAVSLAPGLPADEAALPQTLRELIFRPEANEPFWDAGGPAADFTRALSWCLAMDPLRLPGTDAAAVNALELDTLPPDVRLIPDEGAWAAFKAWALFLGFGWHARFPEKHALVIDPTPAIRDALPAVFAGATGDLTQRDFLDRLAERLPVLDGGTYRRQVEAKLLPRAWPKPKPDELSASLSLALKRLEADGAVVFANLADPRAGRATLTGRDGRPLAAVSHVARAGAAA